MGFLQFLSLIIFPFLLYSEPVFENAHVLFYQNKFEEACAIYLTKDSDPESLSYAALCLDRLAKKEEAKHLRKKIFQELPQSSFTEEALFLYLSDQKNPNLDLLLSQFPKSPFAAYFWTLKVDESLKEENFELAKKLSEQIVDHLCQNTQSYFIELKHRAFLSCAKSEYGIARNSDEKKLHVEYGLADLRRLLREEISPVIEQERDYLFSLFYLEKEEKRALKWIDRTLHKYRVDHIEKSPFLFRLLKLKSEIAWKRGQLDQSIATIQLAEDAYIPRYVDDDDFLDLLLLKTKIFLKQNNYDAALNHLAAIINSPIISLKRLEAIVLRQEIFTSMGRPDLADRHLDTMQILRKNWEKTYGKLDHSPK